MAGAAPGIFSGSVISALLSNEQFFRFPGQPLDRHLLFRKPVLIAAMVMYVIDQWDTLSTTQRKEVGGSVSSVVVLDRQAKSPNAFCLLP